MCRAPVFAHAIKHIFTTSLLNHKYNLKAFLYAKHSCKNWNIPWALLYIVKANSLPLESSGLVEWIYNIQYVISNRVIFYFI